MIRGRPAFRTNTAFVAGQVVAAFPALARKHSAGPPHPDRKEKRWQKEHPERNLRVTAGLLVRRPMGPYAMPFHLHREARWLGLPVRVKLQPAIAQENMKATRPIHHLRNTGHDPTCSNGNAQRNANPHEHSPDEIRPPHISFPHSGQVPLTFPVRS